MCNSGCVIHLSHCIKNIFTLQPVHKLMKLSVQSPLLEILTTSRIINPMTDLCNSGIIGMFCSCYDTFHVEELLAYCPTYSSERGEYLGSMSLLSRTVKFLPSHHVNPPIDAFITTVLQKSAFLSTDCLNKKSTLPAFTAPKSCSLLLRIRNNFKGYSTTLYAKLQR